MSTNKLLLCLIALFLVLPSPIEQTAIKRTDKTETKSIDTKTITDRKKDVHVPYDDRNVLTFVDFNKQAINESHLPIANYSTTNKKKESDLNDTKSGIDTFVRVEDANNAFEKRNKTSRETKLNQEYVKGKVSKNIKEYQYIQINDKIQFSSESEEFPKYEVEGKLDNYMTSKQKEKKQSNPKVEQRDITNAIDHGMRALEELVKVKEPLLYKLGLFLDDNEPAARVSRFGAPTSKKAILMSHIGYATVEASRKIAEAFHLNIGRQAAGIPTELQSKIDLDQCPLRGRPRCPAASRRFRTSDGTCNNLEHPWRGSAMLPMQRFLPPVYEDGIQSVRLSILGPSLPSPRKISTLIHRDKNQEIQSVTLMFTQWGQFIDHDVTSTVKASSFNGSIPRCCEGGGRRVLPPELLHPSCLPIEVPQTDPFLSRFGIGCMEFIRSAPSTRVDCELGWREQINQVTPYIDASMIYGSDVDTSDSIRTFRNGKIFYGRASDQEPLNPPDPPGGELCREGALSEECFQAGDGRASENPGLVAMHTIFVRYHNKVATVLSKINAHWSDERVFQETRKIVYSVIQHITYREYLPVVLGPEVMDLFELRLSRKDYYDKYEAKINPAIANSFSTAAFRFGHSMVQNSFIRTDSHHRPLPDNTSLHNEIFNFENIWSFGSIDRFLLGLSNQPSQKRDEFMADELTNHLFQFSDSTPFGMDLAAINIQRGRDHGIPPYTFWRKPCGLSPINDWRDLEQAMSFNSANRLKSLYAHVDDIDLFTAGLAEKPLRGAVVGPTFACILAQQFSNLRKGDRFWYENEAFDSSFSPAQLQQIRKVSLAQIMCQTMDKIETIQPFVFLSADNFRNIRVSCESPDIRTFDLEAWAERSFELNSILSDNIDSFESERSFLDLTRLKRNSKFIKTITEDLTNKTIADRRDSTFNLTKTDNEHRVTPFNFTDHLPKYRPKRDTNNLKSKKTKGTTKRPLTSTTKIKTNSDKKVAKTKAPIAKPILTNETGPVELKYDDFNNHIPKKPNFSGYSTTRPTKTQSNYYQIHDNKHDDVTYLVGLVPDRKTRPPTGIPVQLNINIQFSPAPSATTPAAPLKNKKKRPTYSSTRPALVATNDYVTFRPSLTNIYRPSTQTYEPNDVIVITRRPSVTSTKPEVVSYPDFVYTPAYERPNYYQVTSKKPTYFFDNIEYATANGHKRPNNNGLRPTISFEGPRPISGYYSNSNSHSDNFDKPPHVSYRPTTEYFSNDHDSGDFYDNQDKEPVYVSTFNNQNSYSSTIFENRPFSISNRPTTYTTRNKYSDRLTTKRPTYSSYYFDNDSDTVVITGNKKRPQNHGYNRDENTATDDISNEFFHRNSDEEESSKRKSSDLIEDFTSRTSINDKLDFKSRIILYKHFNDKEKDGFVQISAVKKEEEFSRESEDVIKEKIPKERLQKKVRRSVKKVEIINVDVSPSESSGEWKLFNATDESMPYMEVPELPINVPCSYEVPKPMTELLPFAEGFNKTRSV